VILSPASNADPPGSLGGKATSWWRMSIAGLPVPHGFCVPARADVSAAMLAGALASLRERCGAMTVAVRSSAIGEDGASHAFAGLFESLLDVPAEAVSVWNAIVRCRGAGQSARARSATGGSVEIGVLVQEMIHPSRSGVLFTRDPLRRDRGAVVEVVQGHLSGLVDGRRDGRRVQLEGVIDESILSAAERDDLLRLGRATEELMRCPTDIEWASVGGRIVLLQARPITSLEFDQTAGLALVAVSAATTHRLPRTVLQHDKIVLRLAASALGIGISNGYVALASAPRHSDVAACAKQLAAWGEFIAVLLDPFDLDGHIFRRFGTGPTAEDDLAAFVEKAGAKHTRFAFLLKELQDTAMTGVAVRVADGGVRVEIIEGHFITKGFEAPTTYALDSSGMTQGHTPGQQRIAVQVRHGKKERVQVGPPPSLEPDQLSAVFRAACGLADRFPGAGIEFGFTPRGEFFLVDLYQGRAVVPPLREGVLSEGRVVGRVHLVELQEDAIELSVERHVHSRRSEIVEDANEHRILVVRRPFHMLDQLIYKAKPGTIGFICEGGALLCHLAVVMREHGVPGLVMPDSMRTFSDGERIVLDTRPGSAALVVRL